MVKTKKTPQVDSAEKGFNFSTILNPTIIGISIVVIIITAVAITSSMREKGNQDEEDTSSIQKEIVLPDGWTKVADEEYENTFIKKQEDENAFTPTVAYDRNTVQAEDPDDYFNKVIAGAQSAIPSLRLEKTEQSKFEGYTVLNLEGSYIENGDRIQIRQRLLVQDRTLHTLAASFMGTQDISEVEIDAMFDYIVQTEVLQ